jgi:hypothetical protein
MAIYQILEDLQDMIDNGDEEEVRCAKLQLELIDRIRNLRQQLELGVCNER